MGSQFEDIPMRSWAARLKPCAVLMLFPKLLLESCRDVLAAISMWVYLKVWGLFHWLASFRFLSTVSQMGPRKRHAIFCSNQYVKLSNNVENKQ